MSTTCSLARGDVGQVGLVGRVKRVGSGDDWDQGVAQPQLSCLRFAVRHDDCRETAHPATNTVGLGRLIPLGHA